jgi:hypothetical protein
VRTESQSVRTACALASASASSPSLRSVEDGESPTPADADAAAPLKPAKARASPAPIEPHAAGDSFADDFLAAVKRVHPTAREPTPAAFDSWRREARLMLDRDRRPEDEARALAQWLFGDTGTDASFWRANVLSVPKFREKYDQLSAQMRRQGGAKSGGSRQQSSLLAWAYS